MLASSIAASVAVSGSLYNSDQAPLAASVGISSTAKIIVSTGSVRLRSPIGLTSSAAGSLSVIRKRDINDVLPAHLVEQQFPSFIRDDYPKMVDFVRAYYDYMAQTENGRIKNLRDIDETSGDYLNHLQNEFLYNAAKPNFEQDFAAEDFIRFSRQFYAAKGTEESIKFLFRAQANQEVEIEYPSELIFKPSTAQWYQEQSIKVVMTQDSIPATYFIGSYLTVRNKKGEEQALEISNVIDLTQKTTSTDLSTEFEIFFITELIISVEVGNEVFGTNFSAVITPSLSSVEIIDPGVDFRVGQVVKLDGITGSGAVAVITKVLDGGVIRNLKLIKFGSSYVTDFYLSIEPEGVFTNTGASFTVATIEGVTATTNRKLTDVTEGFLETQSILRSDYVLNNSPDAFPFYTYPGYDGKYVSQLSNRQVFFLEENYSALLLCKVGAVCKYPGKYLDQTGMPSNASVLQDNNYYQDFSYVIKSNLDIENYRDTITALAHPAGFKMFGELSIDNQFSSDTTAGDSVVVTSQVPSLNLDFISSNTLDPRITFTRASTGTYFDSAGVLKSAAINAARFDYNPTTLAAQGLLIEEQRTNLLTYSEDFSNAAWLKTDVTVSADNTTAPDGTNTADLLTEGTAGTAVTTRVTSPTVTAGSIVSTSIFIKRSAVVQWVRIRLANTSATNGGNVWFNIQTGALGNQTNIGSGTATSGTITALNSSWYRLTATTTLTAGDTTASMGVFSASANGVTTRVSNSAYWVWGAQLEVGSFPTSYIPTTAATATRSVDTATMIGTNFSNWYNQSQGTLFAEVGYRQIGASFQCAASFNDNGANNRWTAGINPPSAAGVALRNTGGVGLVTSTTSNTAVIGNTNKLALAVSTGCSLVLNGSTVVTSATYAAPTVTQLQIGNQLGAGYLNGHIRFIAYYNSRLSNSELQSITT